MSAQNIDAAAPGSARFTRTGLAVAGGLTIAIAIGAVALGGRIIEKHFTLDKALFGPDHKGSMSPEELSRISIFANELVRVL